MLPHIIPPEKWLVSHHFSVFSHYVYPHYCLFVIHKYLYTPQLYPIIVCVFYINNQYILYLNYSCWIMLIKYPWNRLLHSVTWLAHVKFVPLALCSKDSSKTSTLDLAPAKVQVSETVYVFVCIYIEMVPNQKKASFAMINMYIYICIYYIQALYVILMTVSGWRWNLLNQFHHPWGKKINLLVQLGIYIQYNHHKLRC